MKSNIHSLLIAFDQWIRKMNYYLFIFSFNNFIKGKKFCIVKRNVLLHILFLIFYFFLLLHWLHFPIQTHWFYRLSSMLVALPFAITGMEIFRWIETRPKINVCGAFCWFSVSLATTHVALFFYFYNFRYYSKESTKVTYIQYTIYIAQ